METGQTTIRASVLNEQVIEVAPGWVAALEGALPHARYRALALYDARGEVLHCTSTDFGIEFRQALNDALDAFVLGAARESRFLRGEGTRTAIMLALRDLHSALQGVCLLVVEDTPPEDQDPAARFLTPAVQTILADVASEVAQTLHAMPAQKPAEAQARRCRCRSRRCMRRSANSRWCCAFSSSSACARPKACAASKCCCVTWSTARNNHPSA